MVWAVDPGWLIYSPPPHRRRQGGRQSTTQYTRVWARQATRNRQILMRYPDKVEQGSDSPPGPAKPSFAGSLSCSAGERKARTSPPDENSPPGGAGAAERPSVLSGRRSLRHRLVPADRLASGACIHLRMLASTAGLAPGSGSPAGGLSWIVWAAGSFQTSPPRPRGTGSSREIRTAMYGFPGRLTSMLLSNVPGMRSVVISQASITSTTYG